MRQTVPGVALAGVTSVGSAVTVIGPPGPVSMMSGRVPAGGTAVKLEPSTAMLKVTSMKVMPAGLGTFDVAVTTRGEIDTTWSPPTVKVVTYWSCRFGSLKTRSLSWSIGAWVGSPSVIRGPTVSV